MKNIKRAILSCIAKIENEICDLNIKMPVIMINFIPLFS
jgi:hypothetical protein